MRTSADCLHQGVRKRQAQGVGTSSHLGYFELCFQAVIELSVPEVPDSSPLRHWFFPVGLSQAIHSIAGTL